MSTSEFQQEISSSNLIKSIIEDLFSYNTIKRKRILEYYYFRDSTYTSSIMMTKGVDNIQHMYTVWQTLNRTEPTITNIVFDGQTAVIHLIHHLSPVTLPRCMKLQVPAITTLYFRETERDSGLLKIYKQEDNWTLEGLIQSIPFISLWYNNILRVIMGKIMATTGDIFESAFMHAEEITNRSKDIQLLGRGLSYPANSKQTHTERAWKECVIESSENEEEDSRVPLQEQIYLEEE